MSSNSFSYQEEVRSVCKRVVFEPDRTAFTNNAITAEVHVSKTFVVL
jgi:hypothetical protein